MSDNFRLDRARAAEALRRYGKDKPLLPGRVARIAATLAREGWLPPLEDRIGLLPCPFCGSPPEVRPEYPEAEGDSWTEIRCANAACPVMVEVSIFAEGDHLQSAIEMWNDRPDRSDVSLEEVVELTPQVDPEIAQVIRVTAAIQSAAMLGADNPIDEDDAEILAMTAINAMGGSNDRD